MENNAYIREQRREKEDLGNFLVARKINPTKLMSGLESQAFSRYISAMVDMNKTMNSAVSASQLRDVDATMELCANAMMKKDAVYTHMTHALGIGDMFDLDFEDPAIIALRDYTMFSYENKKNDCMSNLTGGRV